MLKIYFVQEHLKVMLGPLHSQNGIDNLWKKIKNSMVFHFFFIIYLFFQLFFWLVLKINLILNTVKPNSDPKPKWNQEKYLCATSYGSGLDKWLPLVPLATLTKKTCHPKNHLSMAPSYKVHGNQFCLFPFSSIIFFNKIKQKLDFYKKKKKTDIKYRQTRNLAFNDRD